MRLIVAVDEKWGIGKDGDLLKSIPEDMKFFREKTKRAALVMGYNTLISFPNSKPLPGRLNIVLADIKGLKIPGAAVCDSMDMLFRLITNFRGDDVYVIGGGSMYRQLLPYCDTAYITKMRFDGSADTFIPDIDALPEWSVLSESQTDECDGIEYSFVEYRSSSPSDFPGGLSFRGTDADITEYFVRKKELSFSLSDYDDPAYRGEIAGILRGIFCPIGEGLTAEQIGSFLGSGLSFKDYLIDRGYIATSDMIDACNKRYRDKAQRSYNVRVHRTELDRFIAHLSSGEPIGSFLKPSDETDEYVCI